MWALRFEEEEKEAMRVKGSNSMYKFMICNLINPSDKRKTDGWVVLGLWLWKCEQLGRMIGHDYWSVRIECQQDLQDSET